MSAANEYSQSTPLQRSNVVEPNRWLARRLANRTEFEEVVVFAALERGSNWVKPIGQTHAHVIHQDAGEPSKEFARRAIRALTNDSRARVLTRLTLILGLACGTRTDQLEARCAIGTALLRCFSDAQFELVLVCNRDASGDEQAQALALAEGLSEGKHARRVSVCLAG